MCHRSRSRILLISDHFFPEPFLGNEIPDYLRANGYDVEVLTQNPAYPEGAIYPGAANPFFQITRMNGVRIYRFKTITGYRDSLVRKIANYLWFMFASSLFVIIAAVRYNYFFVYHVGTLTEAVPLYLARRIYNKRTSIWTQDIWPDSVYSFGFNKRKLFAKILTCFVSGIYSSIESIMVSSPGFVGKLKEVIVRNKTPIFIPQWAPEELFALDETDIDLSDRTINFVFAGNVGTQQNLERVTLAFGIAKKQGINCCFHIVGEGRSLEEIKNIIRNGNIDNVKIHGRIPQGQILSLIRKANACVLSLSPEPTIELTLPAKFQAYLFSWHPILCVARGESKMLVDKYDLGEVALPDSCQSIVEAIERICNYSLEDKERIAQNMKNIATNLFQADISKMKILACITGQQRIEVDQ